MTPYERLRDSLIADPQVLRYIDTEVYNTTKGGGSTTFRRLGEYLEGRLRLSAVPGEDALLLVEAGSRAKQPACAVISRNEGQFGSPSALFSHRTAFTLVQVFEGGADDRDLAGEGAGAAYWIEAQDRVLLC